MIVLTLTDEEALFVLVHLDTYPNPDVRNHPLARAIREKISEGLAPGDR